jgi:aryl-alcohol dehydrogenase-like predicted oxidoreductase
MRYKLFGKSGLRVSELCLGTMTFGPNWGWGADKKEAQLIFEAFATAGGNFIDTANRYTDGTAETYLGEFLASDRDHFVLATKYSLFDRKDDPNFSGNHRKNMVRSLEASLKRLRTGFIDIFWLHAWDFMTPVEEIMRGLDDLVRAGKIHYVGISDTPAWIVSQANTMADLRGWTSFTGLQFEYSLVERTAERDLMPMARSFGMAMTPWAILGAGVLSGKYNPGKNTVEKGRAALWGEVDERRLRIAQIVEEIANEMGCSTPQVAINWVRQQPGAVIPILGARKFSQIEDNLAALDYPLNSDQIARLDQASRIDLGFPHDFLASEGVRNLVTGGTYNQIDKPNKS